MKRKSALNVLGAIFVIILVACSGGGSDGSSGSGGDGGDGGSSGQAPVTTGSLDSATKELAVAAKETSSQIIASESDMAVFKNSDAKLSVVDILDDALAVTSKKQSTTSATPDDQVLRGATETDYEDETGECGGSMHKTCVTTADEMNAFPYSKDCESVLEDYCNESGDYEIVFNGTLTIYTEFTDVGNGFLEYGYDITYTTNLPFDPSGTLRYKKICRWIDGEETCSTGVYESEATTYTTSDVFVSGNASAGYNIDYTIIDGEGNNFYVAFTDLAPCENGHIGSGGGTVTFSGNEVLSFVFTSCDEFSVTYNGISETIPQ